MLSRVADALYWMSRYVERAEHAARVIEVTRRLLIDLREVDPEAADEQWSGAIQALGLGTDSIQAAVFDEHQVGSVASSISRARENARQVREVISSEMWDAVNRAYWALLDPPATPRRRDEILSDVLVDATRASFLWGGVADATMGRGEGWLFIRLGQFVERADRLIRFFNVRWRALEREGQANVWRSGENAAWVGLLRGCGVLEEYRKRYPTHTDPRDIVDLLVLDRVYPRTVGYAIAVSSSFTERLADITGERGHPTRRAFGRLAARLEYTELDELLGRGPATFLDEIHRDLSEATYKLQTGYFQH